MRSVCGAIFVCQCLGALVVMIARAASPGKVSSIIRSSSNRLPSEAHMLIKVLLRHPVLFLCHSHHSLPLCILLQLGPYIVFPDLALWDTRLDGWWNNPIISPVFWICLACQLAIVVGYMLIFRKEQLSKRKSWRGFFRNQLLESHDAQQSIRVPLLSADCTSLTRHLTLSFFILVHPILA